MLSQQSFPGVGRVQLLTPYGAAAVDKLTPTRLARLQLHRLHTLHLGLQSRFLSAVSMSYLASTLRLLYPTNSYTHACDSPYGCMGTQQSHPACMERIGTANMRLSCLHCLRVMDAALQALRLSGMVGGFPARLVGLLGCRSKHVRTD